MLVQQMLLERIRRHKVVEAAAAIRQLVLDRRKQLGVGLDRSRLNRRRRVREAGEHSRYEPRREPHDHRRHNVQKLGDPLKGRRLDFLVVVLHLLQQAL